MRLAGGSTRGRVNGWWLARVCVLLAIAVCAVVAWTVPDTSSAYIAVVPLWTLATFVGGLFVLINGPQPRWATRWAWFWLILNPAIVVTLPLFVISSGPLRPTTRPTAPSGRRLTGGWAFLFAVVVLGSVRVHH